MTNLAPDDSRAVHHLTASIISEGALRLTAQRCARVSGRLVKEGEPLSNVRVTPKTLPRGDFTPSLAAVTTDENGFFTAVLIPGCKYALRMEGQPFNFASFDEDIALAPGEDIELGTLALSEGRKFKRRVEPEQRKMRSHGRVSPLGGGWMNCRAIIT